MRRYILNSPVLTDYGDFRFEGPLGLEVAREFAALATDSAVGHAATATFLSQRLGVDVPLRRTSIRMQPGDQALVLRLVDRLPENTVLDDETLSATRHEFGLLTRLA